MLNNIQLTDETKAVLVFETGVDAEDIESDLNPVDTRDTLEDFKRGCCEFGGKWDEWKGTRYFVGTIQKAKGMTRQNFYLIPQGEWNIVVIW